MHLAELIYLITREIREHSVSKLEAEIKKNEMPVMNALRYINLNSAENISLDFISDYVHMSKSNFCLVFKKIHGISPSAVRRANSSASSDE